MTDDEIKEACAYARQRVCKWCPGTSDASCAACATARALLAVVAQRDEARGEIDRITARLAKANGQRDSARDLHEKSMTMIHEAAGVARNGLCGILAFIDNAKEAEQRALDEVAGWHDEQERARADCD